MTLDVEDIEYDNEGCKLRVKGRNIEENEFVKMGAYHTIDIEPNRKFTLAKTEWDTVALERVEVATDPSKTADVAAITMQEGTNIFSCDSTDKVLLKLLSFVTFHLQVVSHKKLMINSEIFRFGLLSLDFWQFDSYSC